MITITRLQIFLGTYQVVKSLRQLRQSGLIGLWKNRFDIIDSAVYARQLREQVQQRGHINDDFSG